MRPLATAAAVVCLWLAAPAAQQSPKLLVIVVADQFRADYLTTFASHWRAGFRTLLAEGAVFTNAVYPYQETETCPGHFTIGTGTLPRTHGMVGNDWWDAETSRIVECTDDPRVKPVSYGRPSRLGKSARFLEVPTLADELRGQRRGARVVSVSIKARSAIGLAGRGGNAVTWFEEGAGVGAFMTSSAYTASPVRAVRSFIQRDPFEKEFGRLWDLRDSGDRYRYPDAGVGERPRAPRLGVFPHATRGAANSRDDSVLLWRESPFSDAYIARMAIALVDAFGLGQRNDTDFLGVGFSATDTVGHRFGPESREVEDTVARQDDSLGTLIRHLDARVGRSNYVLAFSADHGVAPVSVTRGAGRIATDDVRERIDEVLTRRFGKTARRWTLMGGSQPTLAAEAKARLKAEPAVVQEIVNAVEAIPGVERLLPTARLSADSSDRFARAAALSFMEGRSGDFIVIPKPYWTIAPRNGVNGTEHSSPHDYDQRVPLILLGGGIRPGRYEREATPADIAPTLARIANVRLEKAEGRILEEALR